MSGKRNADYAVSTALLSRVSGRRGAARAADEGVYGEAE
jgi:hypothetical protein